MDLILFLKIIFVSIVEGITEFLPVSSTGHMIIVENYIKIFENREFAKAFMVMIQFGAILSVVVYFFKDIWPFYGEKSEQKKRWKLWSKVLVGVLPAGVLGLLFDDYIEAKFFNSKVVAITLIFYGIILIFIEKYTNRGGKESNIENLTYKTAFIIGLFQCLAMIPGTSRSAATIIGGLMFGLTRAVAAEFSFFLAIPIMAGATLLKLIKNGVTFTGVEWLSLIIGNVIAFVVALGVIKLFMSYIKNRDFRLFGYYRIVLGILVLELIRRGVLKI